MIIEIETGRIKENPWQVRREIDGAHVAELAEDIRLNGLLQAPMGRLVKQDGVPYSLQEMSDIRREEYHRHFVQLAFGHNRLRAFRLLAEQQGAVWKRIPVDVRVLSDEQMAKYAWSENERRQDITPIDKAEAIRKRMDDFGWTQAEVGAQLGMAQSTVAHLLRILKLPEEVKASVMAGEISQRQAKVLVSAPEDIQGEIVQAAKDGVSAEGLREEIIHHREHGEHREEILGESANSKIMPAGIISTPEDAGINALVEVSREEWKRQCNAIFGQAALLLADRLEVDDPKGWRMLLRWMDLDFRNNTRNWDSNGLRLRVAMNVVKNPYSHRQDPAEDYMYVRDLFRAVGLDLPSFEEMVSTNSGKVGQDGS